MARFEVFFGERGRMDAEAVVQMRDTLPSGEKIAMGEVSFVEERGKMPLGRIYAAVPEWMGGELGEMKALSSCCRAVLRLAEERGARTVHFPSAPKEYPVSQAATVMERAIMDSLRERHGITQIRIFCDSMREAEIYRLTYNLWYAERKSDRL